MKHKKNYATTIFFLAWLLLSGCAGLHQVKQHPVKGSYYVARATFNDALESYLAQRPAVTEEERQEIEPVFFEGKRALDLWGTAIKAGDSDDITEKARAYDLIKTELFRALIRYGVIDISE